MRDSVCAGVGVPSTATFDGRTVTNTAELSTAYVAPEALQEAPGEDTFFRLARLTARALGVAAVQIYLLDGPNCLFQRPREGGETWSASEADLLARHFAHPVAVGGQSLMLSDVSTAGLAPFPLASRLGECACLVIPLFDELGRGIGAIAAYEFHRKDWRLEDVEVLQDSVDAITSAIDLKVQRLANSRAQHRLVFLAQAGCILASSLEYEITFEQVARLSVPYIADWCLVRLEDQDGVLRRVAAAHADPVMQELLDSLEDGSADDPLLLAVAAGTPMLFQQQAIQRVMPKVRPSLLRLGVQSTMCVPLQVRGSVSGYILFGSGHSARAYCQDDLNLAQDLARSASIAIENGRLYQEAQEALSAKEEARALLDTMLAGMPVGFAFFDCSSRYVCVNEALAEMHHRPQQDHVGRLVGEVLPMLAARLERIHRQVMENSEPVLDVEFSVLGRGRDGGARHWLASYYPVRTQSGSIIGVGEVVVDITERKVLEKSLRQRADGLAQADQRKDEFLAMLAHELRNPLAPIMAGLELMRFRSDEETSVRAQQIVARQVQHMVRLVDDLLDISRVATGKVVLQTQPIDLKWVMEQATEMARPLIEGRSHRLNVEFLSSPLVVEGDLARLSQVFGNLLNNAAKYTDVGGCIQVRAEACDSQAVISVRDNGAGIPKEMLPHVFELFTQVDRSLDRSQGGLGIGLTLVQSLVEMHGGSVEAISEGLGKGSEFVVRLPRRNRAGGAIREGGSTKERRATPTARILVVEDNTDAAELMAELLGFWGHEVRTAADGHEALRMAAEWEPAIALIDIGLPGLDGYAVAARLREAASGSSIRLIAVTGYGQEDDRRHAYDAGFDLHLTKPVEPIDLQHALAALLETNS